MISKISLFSESLVKLENPAQKNPRLFFKLGKKLRQRVCFHEAFILEQHSKTSGD